MTKSDEYCIYTDKHVARENGNMDHIIPLSLGGANEFVVWSDRAYNSRLGSKVDAKMLQDIGLPFALRNAGVKGHSKKPIIPQWKKVAMNDRPMQVTFGLDEITAWDAKSRKTLTQEELKGKPFEATFKLDTDMNYRFIAKVCLAGGYFLYGDTFRELSECQTLRQLMEFDRKVSTRDDYKASTTRFCDRFHPDAQAGGNAYFERVLCETVGRSILISEPHQKGIAMHLGLVGQYIGSLDIPCDTTPFPLGGEHDLGHVIILAPGPTERMSYRQFITKFKEEVIDPQEGIHDGNE